MGKIKVNLSSGTLVEKPLVTCFQGTSGNYLVLDNETNGSMGLPIICISKFNNNIAEKIVDPNEWASVKENLKTIISGTNLPYIQVPESITASDDFFTQLTLPVASFDLLKNVYKPVENTVTDTITMPAAEAPTTIQSPVEPIAPAIPEVPTMDIPSPSTISPIEPVAPSVETPIAPIAPVVPESTPVAEVPAAQPLNTETVGTDIESIKANFMKSCENMFDALIKQFNK